MVTREPESQDGLKWGDVVGAAAIVVLFFLCFIVFVQVA